MKIENGKFYFIKEEFFQLFNQYELMQNKENGNKRPCYFCFSDLRHKEIIWFVPISSKVDKYKKIYENKRKSRKNVYNFVFGKVLGKEKVFLIQNMFPTKIEYIEDKYKTNGQDVEISENLKAEILYKAKLVIELAEVGIPIPFYDILGMRKELLNK